MSLLLSYAQPSFSISLPITLSFTIWCSISLSNHFFLSIFSPWDDDVWPWLGVPVCVADLRVAMGVGFGFVVWLWWVQIWDMDGGRFSLFLSILILFPLFYLFRQNPFAYCLIICWLRLGFFFFGYGIRICGCVEDNGF